MVFPRADTRKHTVKPNSKKRDNVYWFSFYVTGVWKRQGKYIFLAEKAYGNNAVCFFYILYYFLIHQLFVYFVKALTISLCPKTTKVSSAVNKWLCGSGNGKIDSPRFVARMLI